MLHGNHTAVTRRVALGGGLSAVGAVLSACTSAQTPDPSAATRATAALQPTPASPPTVVSASPSPPLTPIRAGDASNVPTRESIIERFGHRRPAAWGLNLPGETVRIAASGHAVALTLDACGGPHGSGYDAALIETLRRHAVKATLMLNARWITANRRIAEELAADPLFEIGNHGDAHQPLSVTPRRAYRIPGTGSLSAMYDEIRGAHDWIVSVRPNTSPAFRSGTAYSDDIGVDVCRAMGSPFVGYTLNSDAGATFTAQQIVAAMLTVKAGDVVIGHMNHPERATAKGYAAALPRLLDAGVTFRHLHA